MGYRMYEAGWCKHCGADLGMQEVNGGRVKKYCGPACRQAARRQRLALAKRDNDLSRYADLVERWKLAGFSGPALAKLRAILAEHGAAAAKAAVEVSLLVAKEVRQGRGQL